MEQNPKPVPGYENYILDPKSMSVINSKTGKRLKPQKNGGGYACVSLYKDGKQKTKMLHRLFAEAYIPNPNNLPIINHKDEDKMNFDLDNLEWCSFEHNQNCGTVNARKSERMIKLSATPIFAVTNSGGIKEYGSVSEASKDLLISKSSIYRVLSGKNEITKGHKFYYKEE